jgi:hypothetical protein
MARHLNIRIPQPCHENWNLMTAQEHGRFCASCKKNVTDFTGMPAASLAHYFNTHRGPGCGRFTQAQLEQDIKLPTKRLPGLRHLIMVAIPALLVSLKTSAQAQIIRSPKEMLPYRQDSPPPLAPPVRSNKILSGIVNSSDGSPIPFATIEIIGAGDVITADANGRFTLVPPARGSIIRITSIGHRVVTMALSGLDNNLPIILPQTQLEVVYVGGYIPYKYRSKKAAKKARNVAKRQDPMLTLSPNPISPGGQISVALQNFEAGPVQIEIISFSGQVLQILHNDRKAGDQALRIATNGLLPGTYIIRVTSMMSGKYAGAQVVVQ